MVHPGNRAVHAARKARAEESSSSVNSKRILIGVGLGLLLILVIWLSWHWIVKPTLAIVPSWGEEFTKAAINNVPAWATTVFGEAIFASWNSLIVFLALLMILLFAFADIISAFSTFSEGTSWAIAIGLAIIASFTGIIAKLTTAMFGGIAAVGALGIGLIVVWAVIMAVLTNFLIGISGIRAMKEAYDDKQEVADAARTMKQGFSKLKAADENIG